MSHRFLIALITAGALSLTTAAWGQQTTAHAGQKRAWTPPRTPDGHPDLDGTWNSASITPLERPVALANKAFYTPAEIEALQDPRLKDLNRDRRDGGANADLGRAYNEGWYDRGTQFGSNLRTSRVIDPPDGRIPPMTPAAQKDSRITTPGLRRIRPITRRTGLCPTAASFFRSPARRSCPEITTTIIKSSRLPITLRSCPRCRIRRALSRCMNSQRFPPT